MEINQQVNTTKSSFSWSGKSRRTAKEDVYEYRLPACSRIPLDFKSECLNAAKLIEKEAAGQKIKIFLSGGLDSEITARAFIDAGVSFEPVFMSYKRQLWDETYHANRFCQEMGLRLATIELDEDKFFDEDLERIAEQYFVNEPFAAFDIKRLELVDGYCVFGTGDLVLEWSQELGNIGSLEIGAMALPQIYLEKAQRKSCYQFFQYTPELMLSYLNEPVIQEWVRLAPEIGFQDVRYFKYHMYKKHWSNVFIRNKYYGYERFADQYFKAQQKLKNRFGYQGDRIHITYESLLNQLDPENRFRSSVAGSGL